MEMAALLAVGSASLSVWVRRRDRAATWVWAAINAARIQYLQALAVSAICWCLGLSYLRPWPENRRVRLFDGRFPFFTDDRLSGSYG